MDFTESIKGLLLLFLAITANFLGNTMNCSIQNLLTNSAIGRNVAIYFLIYFTVHFTSNQHHPIKNFGNAFFIYLLFLLLVKQNIYFFLINLGVIFIIYVNSQIKEYYNKKKDINLEKQSTAQNIQNAVQRNNILLLILPITLLIGFIIYFMEQMNEQKDFDMLTFLFGRNQCDFLNTVTKTVTK
jgi:ATP-dependent Zn protease